ncbi:phospholipase C, phosphocholine-specific [Mitsuaria sp. GD03876]|uniref:phosphocholine-specific phospholipase C n=1 Tax=Mitsuaria sp. GD03876 TaxID=2975399 RepID=UPI0024471C6D|nr:phospholipase C, phosphocholine-specific [Mitsuaria sp. GD03876]MDH0863964.1 phospholipase C, phosphocholine-specific [Mitsuaria sp. GD03876]
MTQQQPPRRQFLRAVATAAGATAAMTSFPPAIARALSIKAAVRTGTIQDVEHIVILTQENRSFDHYFGTMNGVRGFGDPFPAPVADSTNVKGRNVWVQPTVNNAAPGAIAPFHLNTAQNFAFMRVSGTPHSWTDAQAAWDHGRMNNWPKAKQNHSMGYFKEQELPFQFALANAFTLCDAYHCATQTGTNTNRLFIWTGTNDPLRQGNGPSTDNSHDWFNPNPLDDYTWTTYPERLQAAGVSWQVYQNMDDNFTDNSLAGFKVFRDGWYNRPGFSQVLKDRGISTRDLDLLRDDVINNRLPAVSWVVATAEGSEHPGPSSPAQGADYTSKVLDALTANPDVWAKTVLFINFDENDGFFDHMPPPAAPSYVTWNANPAQAVLAGASTVDTTGEYCEILNGASATYLHRPYGMGPRVPLYIVSPWSKGGWVNSQVADHTSTLRFIEARFGVSEPNIGKWRRAVAGDLTSCFNFADPEDSEFFSKLPATVALANKARALPGTTTPPVPGALSLPTQASGVRPARALPYDLQATSALTPGAGPNGTSIAVTFQNTGRAAAVFHVYDRTRLTEVPRRYTVEAGKQLSGSFAPQATGAYDLWILGPNGFHRHLAGNARRPAAAGQPNPDVVAKSAPATGELVLSLVNTGPVAATFTVAHNKYQSVAPVTVTVAPRSSSDVRIGVAVAAHWYDVSVRVNGQADFLRRFAGHVETGAPSVSDPAMEGAAKADQYKVQGA